MLCWYWFHPLKDKRKAQTSTPLSVTSTAFALGKWIEVEYFVTTWFSFSYKNLRRISIYWFHPLKDKRKAQTSTPLSVTSTAFALGKWIEVEYFVTTWFSCSYKNLRRISIYFLFWRVVVPSNIIMKVPFNFLGFVANHCDNNEANPSCKTWCFLSTHSKWFCHIWIRKQFLKQGIPVHALKLNPIVLSKLKFVPLQWDQMRCGFGMMMVEFCSQKLWYLL